MKRIIAKQNYYKALNHIMAQHPEVFNGREMIEATRQEFERRIGRVSEIVSELTRPVAFVYSGKRIAEQKMNGIMDRITSLGSLEANLSDDAAMEQFMTGCRAQIGKVSARRMYFNALNVAEELGKIEHSCMGKKLHETILPGFIRDVEEFGAALDRQAEQLNHRKMIRRELAELLASANLFIKWQLDGIALYFSDDYPDFYSEWISVRGDGSRKKRRKKAAGEEAPETVQVLPEPLAGEPVQEVIVTTPVQITTAEPDSNRLPAGMPEIQPVMPFLLSSLAWESQPADGSLASGAILQPPGGLAVIREEISFN